MFDNIQEWFRRLFNWYEERDPMSHSDARNNVGRPKWQVQAHSDLQRHEGFRKYAYPDPLSSLGKRHGSKFGYRPARQILAELGIPVSEAQGAGAPWTVGYGFTHRVNLDSVISKELADQKLHVEILDHVKALDKLIPSWRHMPVHVQTVLVNLAFNLGYTKLSKFAPTLAEFNAGRYEVAAGRLRRTAWFRQVGLRAVELVRRLETGVIDPQHKVI